MPLGQQRGADQPQFLAGDGDEHHRCLRRVVGHQTRKLHDHGRPGTVVVGTRRVGVGIEVEPVVRTAAERQGVIVPAHQQDALARRRVAPRQGGDDVAQFEVAAETPSSFWLNFFVRTADDERS